MSRGKLGLLGILAVFALVAVNASVAAAADVNLNFEVEDKEVPAGGEKISPTVVVNKAFVLKNAAADDQMPQPQSSGRKNRTGRQKQRRLARILRLHSDERRSDM